MHRRFAGPQDQQGNFGTFHKRKKISGGKVIQLCRWSPDLELAWQQEQAAGMALAGNAEPPITIAMDQLQVAAVTKLPDLDHLVCQPSSLTAPGSSSSSRCRFRSKKASIPTATNTDE